MRSNLTGVGNTRTVPVGKRVEGKHNDTSFSVMRERGSLKVYYNYRRGMQSTLVDTNNFLCYIMGVLFKL
jgi:hypothetical protein